MAGRFPPWSNAALAIAGISLVLGGSAVVAVPMIYVRLPAATDQNRAPEQPIPFDHRHHATRDQIDCLYCHHLALTEAKADVPTTERCMGCHQQIWTDSPMLTPLRLSFASGLPIKWQKVHNLPGFVYFNHAAHVHQGVACFTCHGRVDQMARVVQEASLLMKWCLDCHRAPEANLRPRESVTAMIWQPDKPPAVLGAELAARHGVRRLTYCTACHR